MKTFDEKPKIITDPISGYKFSFHSPFNLEHRLFAFHPIYHERFNVIYSEAKRILQKESSLHSEWSKRLIFCALLYSLAQEGKIEFKQYSHLYIPRGFLSDQEFIARLLYVVPKVKFASQFLQNKFPSFRITGRDIEFLNDWLKIVLSILNQRERQYEVNQYDKEFFKINKKLQKWKLYSTNKHKLPQPVIHYIHSTCLLTPYEKEEWNQYFTETSGSLYLKNRSKSKEAFELFWELLYCIDKIETNDYQNTITQFVVKFLKHKVSEWVAWEPSFFDISLDYRLHVSPGDAWVSAKNQWIIEAQEHKERRGVRKELSNSAADRIAAIRAKRKSNSTGDFHIISAEESNNE